MKRFYKQVSIDKSPAGFEVLLDGKPLRTPLKKRLFAPTSALAEAIAREWDAQVDDLDPQTMPLTRLLNTATDHIIETPDIVIDELMKYIDSDPICYFAQVPPAWASLHRWFAEAMGITLKLSTDMSHVAQSADTKNKIHGFLKKLSPLELTGFQAVASALSSLLVPIALWGKAITADQAFEAAFLEELGQIKQWGYDAAAKERHDAIKSDIASALQFVAVLSH